MRGLEEPALAKAGTHSGRPAQPHRDYHIKPDLIYRKPDATSLELVRLGSHSEFGL